MAEAVTPPNPADGSGGPQPVPDPTLLTIDALRREIAMLENQVDNRLAAAEALNAERFRRIEALLDQAEQRRSEQKIDTKAAVDAALDAQHDAASKMEAAVADQLGSLRSNFDTAIDAVRSKVDDLKDRMTAQESTRQGAVEQRSEARQVSSGVVAAIGVGIALLLAVLTVVSFLATGA